MTDLEEELTDRYGPLPSEARTLLTIIALKQQLRALGISKLEQGPEFLVFSFIPNPPVDPQRLLGLIQQKPDRKKPGKAIRLTPDQRLIVPFSHQENLFVRIQSVLQTLKG